MPAWGKINNRLDLNLLVTGNLKFPSSQAFVLAAPVRCGRIQASERPDIMCETSVETPTLSRRYPQNLSYIAKLEFHKKMLF